MRDEVCVCTKESREGVRQRERGGKGGKVREDSQRRESLFHLANTAKYS